MTCPLHTAPQSFCARCAEVTAMSSSQMTVVSWPKPLAHQHGDNRCPSCHHTRGIHGENGCVYHRGDPGEECVEGGACPCKRTRDSLEAERMQVMGDRPRTVTLRELPITDSIRDASAARIAGLEANVNEKLLTIAALRDEIAQLRSVESVAIAAARIAALAAALRKALADVDPKAMSTYEQQQARREARALLEEVA